MVNHKAVPCSPCVHNFWRIASAVMCARSDNPNVVRSLLSGMTSFATKFNLVSKEEVNESAEKQSMSNQNIQSQNSIDEKLDSGSFEADNGWSKVDAFRRKHRKPIFLD